MSTLKPFTDLLPKPAENGAHCKRLAMAFLGAGFTMGMLAVVGFLALTGTIQERILVMLVLPFALMGITGIGHGLYHLNDFHTRFGSQNTED